MKASDISDEDFINIVKLYNEPNDLPRAYGEPWEGWVFVWDLAQHFNAPEKVIREKARKLIRRGKLGGCPCGCRGDFRMPWQ